MSREQEDALRGLRRLVDAIYEEPDRVPPAVLLAVVEILDAVVLTTSEALERGVLGADAARRLEAAAYHLHRAVSQGQPMPVRVFSAATQTADGFLLVAKNFRAAEDQLLQDLERSLADDEGPLR